jgi:regulator of replication initiation timing
METYKIVYDNSDIENQFQGVYAISLVDEAANETNFIALSKNKINIKLNNEPKKILTGVVLIPNQMIYRNDKKKGEYNIYFEAETIEKLSQDFLRNGFQKNSTYNHLDNQWLEDISVVEQWIIEDPNNDKSNALGFSDLPKGTWMVSFKVSDKIWDEYVKTGKVTGFSIDSFLDMEKVSMNTNKNKNKKMSLLKRLRMALATSLMKQISIEGKGDLFADDFEVGNEVFFEDELLVSTSFDYDGFTYLTDEEGVIISKEEIVEEVEAEKEKEEKEKEKEEKEIELEISEEGKEEIVDIAESIAEEVIEEGVSVEVLQEMVSFLEEKVKGLEIENEELKTRLSKTPNTSKLKTNENTSLKTTLKGKEGIIDLLIKNKK